MATSYAIQDTTNSLIGIMHSIGGGNEGGFNNINFTDITPTTINTKTVTIGNQLLCGDIKPSDQPLTSLIKLSDIFASYDDLLKFSKFPYTLNYPAKYPKGFIQQPLFTADGNSLCLVGADAKTLVTLDSIAKDNTNTLFNTTSIYLQRDPCSIIATSWVHSNLGFIQSSDRRIKRDIETYDSLLALEKIKSLRVVSYKKIETPFQKEIGFIAQEVYDILPHSIEKMKMYIPNIYEWVQCTYDEKLCLISIDKPFNYMEHIQIRDENNKSYSCTVIDIEYKTILHSTDFASKPPCIKDRVFLYGKSVDDFMSLNKDEIFSIAVSAIQSLDQKVVDLSKRLDDLSCSFKSFTHSINTATNLA